MQLPGGDPERDFIAPDWQEVFAGNGITDFETLWNLDARRIDSPNRHRGGWSTVARCELALPQGGVKGVYIKRQQNFRTHSWLHPIAGDPTALREFRQLVFLRGRGIRCVEPVCFALRRHGRNHRAVLVTAELDGFVDLDELGAHWRKRPVSWALRRGVVDAVAKPIRALHACRIRHGCLYPKHVFVRIAADGEVDVRLIDLEKAGWRPLRSLFAVRDLASFCKYLMQNWSRSERLRFLCAYLGEERTTPAVRRLWRRIEARLLRRRRGAAASVAKQ